MKTVVIGDIHGDSNWKRILEKETFDRVIFLGDFFDSFTVGTGPQVSNFLDIMGLGNHLDVIYLVGNHDYHYLYGFDRSSGYQSKFEVTHAVRSYADRFKMAHFQDGILFSHAGVSFDFLKRISKANELPLPTDPEGIVNHLNECWHTIPRIFKFETEYYRNESSTGDNIDQGPLWIRPESLNNGTLNFKFKQVVGHTVIFKDDLHYKFNGRNYFMDRLNSLGEYLVIENGFINLKSISYD